MQIATIYSNEVNFIKRRSLYKIFESRSRFGIRTCRLINYYPYTDIQSFIKRRLLLDISSGFYCQGCFPTQSTPLCTVFSILGGLSIGSHVLHHIQPTERLDGLPPGRDIASSGGNFTTKFLGRCAHTHLSIFICVM